MLDIPELEQRIPLDVIQPDGEPGFLALNPHDTPEVTIDFSIRSSGPLLRLGNDPAHGPYRLTDEGARQVAAYYGELRGFWTYLIRTARKIRSGMSRNERRQTKGAKQPKRYEWFQEAVRDGITGEPAATTGSGRSDNEGGVQ